VAQTAFTSYSALSSSTVLIPVDDTIPQNSEGNEFMKLTITPMFSSSTLVIEALAHVSASIANGQVTGALFQDSNADALTAGGTFQSILGGVVQLPLCHIMTAGTTSATTFKFRAGGQAAMSATFNGASGSRRYGGIQLSNMRITEFLP
jgi:hypothetical protein